MNNQFKTSHLRTNLVIAMGVIIILISLAWLGYRFAMQIKASHVAEQTIQDESIDQAEPTSSAPDNTEQTSDNAQDTASSDN